VNAERGISTDAGKGFSVFCTMRGLIAWERAGEGKPANPSSAIPTTKTKRDQLLDIGNLAGFGVFTGLSLRRPVPLDPLKRGDRPLAKRW
jgi:hypothetical protein